MGHINITEQVHRVDVQEGVVRVSTIGVAGPPGPQGPPGDLDLEELEQIVNSAVEGHSDLDTGVHGVGESTVASTDDVTAAQSAAQNHADSAVSDHNAETNVHGVDTTQLATQEDLDNLDVLPEPGEDGDVLTLADGEPIWAEPEGGGGLDPDGDEVITGDWLFDRENLRIGSGSVLAIGLENSTGLISSVAIGNNASAQSTSVALGSNTGGGSRSVSIGAFAGNNSNGNDQILIGDSAGGSAGFRNRLIAIGRRAGRLSSADDCTYIGTHAGSSNSRSNRLIIDATTSTTSGNLIDPLIDGRFRDGTDDDAFEYSKGVKINGHLEATDQLILRSPNGSRWAITVDDEGNLSTAPATEAITP